MLKLRRTGLIESGFTIAELLVVIVVIGILAAITIISYVSISNRAKVVSLQSDLTNASKQIKLFQAANASGNYPTANICPNPGTNEICLKSSSGSTLAYKNLLNFDFHLTITNGSISYSINSGVSPAIATSSLTCPAGYIPVPGSGTYGTNDFCVMKYEAKIQGIDNGNQTYSAAFVPESRASGTPWVNITQTSAIIEAQTACTGCHLISEAEWMTIAQNVLSVASNWPSGTIGAGFIYSGHDDNIPAYSLASSTDNDSYFGTGQVTGSKYRRTLTLTNGEVIWDISGNVYDWTSGQAAGGQPGLTNESSYAYKEWNVVNNNGNLSVNVSPSYCIKNASTWTSSQGIGRLYSNVGDSINRGFLRGGDWNHAGVLDLRLDYSVSSQSTSMGFRVAQ